MDANTVSAREKRVFKLYLKKTKKTSVTQVGCVVLCLWDDLSNPKLVVKSCLHKSEVMFFFLFLWCKSQARHVQLLKPRENCKKGNVLATEIRWKPTNMLRQSET